MVNGSWASMEEGVAEDGVDRSVLSCSAVGSAVEGGLVEPVAAMSMPAADVAKVKGAMTRL